MSTYSLLFLLLFPAVAGVLLLLIKNDAARGAIVRLSALCIAVVSIILAIQYFESPGQYFQFESLAVSNAMLVIECLIAAFIFVLGIKYKKYLASILAAVQAPLMVWFELTVGHHAEIGSNMFIDRFSVIMALIIGIIGSAIIVYAIGYMRDFAHHHHEVKDRRPLFFFLMFVFLSAMFGIVFSNNLVWLYFFWEITTLCSFLLIGYTKTPEAIRNSFRAIIMNLVGGLAFALAIVYLGHYDIFELNILIALGAIGAQVGFPLILPIGLIAFAGITKAAQMPFSSWLLGAMVAPTPTSALLHSSTMVKAGVYIIVRLSPGLGLYIPGLEKVYNPAGIMVMMVGGMTFLLASFIAISQSNAKKILAYSTVANLGLIVACGGIGTYEAAWAAILLIIFHAVAKSLLFLSVGTTEHNIGSRDIEDMDGLFVKMPRLAGFMIIGICGMFLAPFGMLISKWAALKSFVDSGNPLMVLIIAFGSAVTLFFWTKWLGKITAVKAGQENIEKAVHQDEWFAIGLHGVLTIVVCMFFPWISSRVLIPFLDTPIEVMPGTAIPIFDGESALALSQNNMYIMVVMLALFLILPLAFMGRNKRRIVPIYLAGANLGDNLTFQGSMGKTQEVGLRNWYMEAYFGERKMNIIGNCITAVLIVVPLLWALVYYWGVM